jgi:hypothetical protein
MKLSPGRHAWRRPAIAAAVLGLVLLGLGACGPGVGGSGTGLEPDVSGPTTMLPVPSLHADAIDGRQVQAVLELSRLQLDLACPRLRFVGLWNGQAGSTLRFDGAIDGDPSRPASAELQISGSSLSVTLRDGSGAPLLGPLTLPSVTTLAPLAGCG